MIRVMRRDSKLRRESKLTRFFLLLFVLASGSLFGLPAAHGQGLLALGESIEVDYARDADAFGSDEVYLHVSVSDRRLTVYRGEELLHRFPVGVGKGGTLRRLDGAVWEWSTPSGIFEVGRKKEDPRWYAPDWYYLEKGVPVPPAYSEARYLGGMLGDYALYLSDEIAIHGTENRSSVGRAASHGCLRMFNEDVAIVFPLVEIGTKVIVTP